MLYMLFGPDDFSLRERLKELKKGWDDEGSLAINTTLFEAERLTLNELVDACNTMPFLGQRRLVMVEGLLSRFESERAQERSRGDWQEWKALAGCVEKMPPTTALVLIDGRVGKGNSLYKSLASQATVQEFPMLRGPRLQQWISRRVVGQGGNISPQAIRLLSEFGGGSLWTLMNELEKLTLYAAGRRIEEDDVRALTSYTREANVFQMVDAIMERQGDVAVRLLHLLLSEGVAAPHLLFMIARQVNLVVRARELRARRVTLPQARDILGLSPAYPVEKLLRQADACSNERLIAACHKLLETDLAIKTGRQEADLALDLLVVELCSYS